MIKEGILRKVNNMIKEGILREQYDKTSEVNNMIKEGILRKVNNMIKDKRRYVT